MHPKVAKYRGLIRAYFPKVDLRKESVRVREYKEIVSIFFESGIVAEFPRELANKYIKECKNA